MTDPQNPPDLNADEESIYAWQTSVRGFGVEGQRRLKGATVLISRVGGLGSLVALELAAAGVGRLVLAHGGMLKPSDLNRQILQSPDRIGRPRIEGIVDRLKAFNPRMEIVALPHHLDTPERATEAARHADLIVDAAPLFHERMAMNASSQALGLPLVECAMYDTSASLTTFIPGRTGCLRCLYPEEPHGWTRRFPVFGAVSGAVGCLGAMEAIKVLAGFGEPLAGVLLTLELRDMSMHRHRYARNPRCACCGSAPSPA
jgi:molybdopterin/thiamine biosynthesis adenylyltransferase